ncbi:MAG: hypothetical protein GAK30_03152 [Paracidovorax wautersii]|uniref:Uncharacterized protein n=1 Tax=Paracidovorax wautersii TaxID=1177982 RepID=A0A7V8FLL5_9BURK|nr:MAG: hypothetical protein GAK30_03152 [Paracidovorax wautersii]
MWIRHWLLALALVQSFGGIVFYSLASAASRSDAYLQQLLEGDDDFELLDES